jgi:hypothetical protein
MSGYNFSKPCPLCGARNSLEVDYNLGEVVCVACVKVVANGLQEDEQERFDKDGGTRMDAGERHGTSKPADADVQGGGTAAISASAMAAKAPLNPTLQRLLKSIRDRSGCPEDVKSSAKALYDAFVAYKMSRTEAVEKKAVLLAACVIIATTIGRFPVTATEINMYEKVAPVHELDRKVDEVLGLGPVVPALGQAKAAYAQALISLPSELAQLFLSRLKWSLAQFQQPVLLVVDALQQTVPGDRRARPEDLVAIALLLLRSRGRIHDLLGSKASTAQTDEQTLAEIAAVVRLDGAELKRRKERIVTSDVLTAVFDLLCTKRVPDTSPVVGTKRPRE